MKRGFTILELLVAAMLLGMLTTILTMIFTQSSVAWRIGEATVADMDAIRSRMGELREKADNAFIYDGNVYQHTSPWDETSNNGLSLRSRAYETMKNGSDFSDLNGSAWSGLVGVGQARENGSYNNYVVNVMSGGPANDIMDWQAIWSYPDDFE